MLNEGNVVIRHLINMFVAMSVLVLGFLGDGLLLPLLSVFVLAPGSYYLSNKIVHMVQIASQAKKIGITTNEYKLIEQHLKQARTQISNLQKGYIRVRSIKSFRMLNDMVKISRRIVNIINKNPQKFFAVEDFFYSHLPSAVEITDKYSMLAKEKVKGIDIELTMEDTRKTLKILNGAMEQDLKDALRTDIENLKIELDFAKLEQEKRKIHID